MACEFDKLPHPGIQTLAPYVPGKPAETVKHELGLTDVIKLASNENPLGCSMEVTRALQRLTPQQIATYSVTAVHPLRRLIAEKYALSKEMVTLGNGSDALFTLLLTCFALHRDCHVLSHEKAFITYDVQANTLGIPIKHTPLTKHWQVDVDNLIAACNKKTALIFLANPNNPTGSLLPEAEIKRLLLAIPESTLLVLDEAYEEYLHEKDQTNSLALLKDHRNLVITRTFSKAYGLAGLRLGYALADAAITAILHKVALPFTVNLAALTAGIAALADGEFIQRSIAMNRQGLTQLKQGFDALGISYLPAPANFITIHCKKDANSLFQYLQRAGIIVRPLEPYDMPEYLRITVGTEAQNARLLAAMAGYQRGSP